MRRMYIEFLKMGFKTVLLHILFRNILKKSCSYNLEENFASQHEDVMKHLVCGQDLYVMRYM